MSQVGDSPDPSIIIAALNRVAEEMASPGENAVAPAVAQQADDYYPAEDSFPLAADSRPA